MKIKKYFEYIWFYFSKISFRLSIEKQEGKRKYKNDGGVMVYRWAN